MAARILLLRVLFLVFCLGCFFSAELSYSQSTNNGNSIDSVWFNNALDSAWGLIQKRDGKALPYLQSILGEAKGQRYKSGEAEALYSLGKYFTTRGENERALKYYDSARMVSEGIQDYGRAAQCLHSMGIVKFSMNDYLGAIDYYHQSLALNSQIDNKPKMANNYVSIGIAYSNLGNYAKALEYYFQGLQIDEQLGSKKDIAEDLATIAMLYENTGDIEKAIEFFNRSIKYSSDSGDEYITGTALTNFGVLLKKQGRLNEAREKYQSALDIFKKLDHTRGIVTNLHNIGALHLEQKNYQDALSFFNQSIEINKIIHDRYVDQANYGGIGQVHHQLGNYKEAIRFASQAYAIAGEISLLEQQAEHAKLLSDIHKSAGNYERSLFFHEQYVVHKDSLFSTEKSRQIKDLQTKYETEKKEQEITALTNERLLQQASLRQKTIIQYAMISGFIILGLLAFVLFRNHRIRQEGRRLLLAEQLKHEKIESERLKELDHVKSRFFANIAHEFRTPLTLILGPIEQLISSISSDMMKEKLVVVKNSASRLIKLVNQLLDLSKLEAGAVKLDLVSDDVIRFIKANTFAFESLADQKYIRLSFSSDIPILIMKFDKDKLEKIFSNLLSNAMKFTPSRGSVQVIVTTENEALQEAQHVKITVKDSGPGIPVDDLALVFNRFYQSHQGMAYNSQGSGIGLELTKELVEILGGNIGVRNTAEGGAEFYFTLPIVKGEVIEIVEEEPELTYAQLELETMPTIKGEETHLQEITPENQELILVIEDNEDVRDFIVSSLSHQYRIITAVEGNEGITKALNTIPDLIISDVMMPEKDGYEVCNVLKQDEKTSHIPVILLTAKADIESKIEGLEVGADDYLPKPFHTKELSTRIRNLIVQRKRLREKYCNALKEELPEDTLPPKERLFFQKLRDTVEQHLAEEEYSIEDLSRDMAMSRTQLHRKVKALTNGSASLFIRSVRLDHAKRLLEEGIYNVSEVAYRVGFNSPTYFSTCFAEAYGRPPSEVRTSGELSN